MVARPRASWLEDGNDRAVPIWVGPPGKDLRASGNDGDNDGTGSRYSPRDKGRNAASSRHRQEERSRSHRIERNDPILSREGGRQNARSGPRGRE